MRKMRFSLALLLCGLVLAGAVWAMSSTNYAINWDVTGDGGGPMASTGYTLNSTIGQGIFGSSQSSNYQLAAGYWPGTGAGGGIYLPVILK